MPDIAQYVDFIGLLLEESGKYFALLLFAVLAIRLWRRTAKVPREKKTGNFLLAFVTSALATGIGYFSICHSMSLMYSHFGTEAFHSYKLEPALALFDTSLNYRKNADALGGKGVCVLWMGNPKKGIPLLNEARTLRGKS